jgi:hypothetical protein
MLRAAALGAVVFVALLVSAWASMPAATPALTTLAAGTADAQRIVAWGLAIACVVCAVGVCLLCAGLAWWVAGCRRDGAAWAARGQLVYYPPPPLPPALSELPQEAPIYAEWREVQ